MTAVRRLPLSAIPGSVFLVVHVCLAFVFSGSNVHVLQRLQSRYIRGSSTTSRSVMASPSCSMSRRKDCGPSVNTLATPLPRLGEARLGRKLYPTVSQPFLVPDPPPSSVHSGYPSQLLVLILPGWHPGPEVRDASKGHPWTYRRLDHPGGGAVCLPLHDATCNPSRPTQDTASFRTFCMVILQHAKKRTPPLRTMTYHNLT